MHLEVFCNQVQLQLCDVRVLLLTSGCSTTFLLNYRVRMILKRPSQNLLYSSVTIFGGMICGQSFLILLHDPFSVEIHFTERFSFRGVICRCHSELIVSSIMARCWYKVCRSTVLSLLQTYSFSFRLESFVLVCCVMQLPVQRSPDAGLLTINFS